MGSFRSRREFNSVVENASYLAGGKVLIYSVRVIYIVILAYFLGPSGYGTYSYGMSWYLAFFGLTELGFGVILSREIGIGGAEKEKLIGITFLLRNISAAVACGLSIAVYLVSQANVQFPWLICIFSVSLIGRAVATWADLVFIAFEKSKYSFQQNLIFRPIEVLLGLSLMALGKDPLWLALAHAVAWWMQAIRGVILVNHRMVKIRTYWDWSGISSFLKKGLVVGVGLALINWMKEGPLVLYRFVENDDAILGQLALSLQPFVVFSTVSMAGLAAVLPVLSRNIDMLHNGRLKMMENGIRVIMVTGSIVGLIGLSLGPQIVHFVFGVRYQYAGELIRASMWLIIPWSIGLTTLQFSFANGKYILTVISAVIGVGVMTVSLVFLSPALNCFGAIFGAMLGMSVWAAILTVGTFKGRSFDIQESLLKPTIALSIGLVLTPAMGGNTGWLVCMLSLLCYSISLTLFGVIKSDERRYLTEIIYRKARLLLRI